MNDFLKSAGYKKWDTKEERIGEYKFVTEKYQKRVDGEPAWLGVHLCDCNEKLFIDIDISTCTNLTSSRVSWTISMRHQSPVNGEWCNLEIYSLPLDKMNSEDLKKLEAALRNMWIAFNKEN